MHAPLRPRAMPRVALTLLALVLLLLGARYGLLVDESAAAPQRMIVGLAEEPRLAVGATVLGEPVVYVEPVLRFVVVETRAPLALEAAARADPGVRYVEPDEEFWLSAWRADDPLLAAQYGPQQVRAPEAWELATGAGERSLCVVDSGVRWTHEDLRGPRYLGGWDFIGGDAEPYDMSGHGTHVLGIAAAGVGNGRGISGIADAPYFVARSAANASHPVSALASAIRWCADVGGDVINLSLGARDGTALREAILYAHGKGALLVAAAGNAGPCSDCMNYPAAWPEVMAVTCTAPSASLPLETGPAFCDFSNEGPEADLAAPGERILSTMTYADDGYYTERGTSMSAPHVSGAALLVWNARPELPARLVWEVLVLAARDLGTEGRDDRFGHGLLDARAAVELVTPADVPVCLLETPLLDKPIGRDVVVWTTAEASVVVLADGVEVPLAREDGHRWRGALPDGTMDVAATCTDADGDARHAQR